MALPSGLCGSCCTATLTCILYGSRELQLLSPFSNAAHSSRRIVVDTASYLNHRSLHLTLAMAVLAAASARHSVVKRASIKPLTPASLALIIVGCILLLSIAGVGYIYYRKRRGRQNTHQSQVKDDDRSSSVASEEHQMESIEYRPNRPVQGNGSSNTTPNSEYRYSVGIMSRMSVGGPARSPRMPRSPAPNNRYSVGMLSRTSVDPAVTSPNARSDRNSSRSRADKDRAYARMSMGIMSRASMGARSPAGPRSPISPRDPLMSAGIMSRQALGPVSPMPRNLSAFSSPNPATSADNGFLEPPPRYS
jgi:hypothetical protein